MPRRFGPPTPRYKTGPRCGPGSLGPDDPGCPYRTTSFGYAPESGDPEISSYLFLLEALGADEVEAGRNAVGETGRIFSQLLLKNTPIRRSEQVVANTVRCRPVAWGPDGKGGQKPLLQESGNHVNAKPSPGQIRECARRYTDDMIQRFAGKAIVALGKIPLQYMTGRVLKISEYRGSIFEPGALKNCEGCDGTGQVPGRLRSCTTCAGRGTLRSCAQHARRRKDCATCESTPCQSCGETGKIAGRPGKCKACSGGGLIPNDPNNPHVCDKLKPGQLLYCTYHPAWLLHQPTQWPLVIRDFSRMAHLEDDLAAVVGTHYDEYPPLGYPEERALLESAEVSVDLETSGLEPTEGDILCVGATHKPGYGCALAPSDPRVAQLLDRARIVGQNFWLFDRWWLHHQGIPVNPEVPIWDTRFAGKLLNPDTPNDLVYLTGEFASPPIRGYWKTRENYRDRIEQVVCIDVDATLRVKQGQYEKLRETGQLHIMENYIMPLAAAVFKMRVGGMRIDKGRMKDAHTRIEAELSDSRLELPDWGGVRTENQWERVQKQLYDVYKLPVQTNRKTGKPTSNSEALEELAARLETGHRSTRDVPDVDEALAFIQRIQNLRGLSKLSNSFLRYHLSPADFVHPALNPCGTGTFRFNCQDPNTQQVPDCSCGLPKKPCKGKCEYAVCKVKCGGACPTCRGARHIFIPDHPDWEILSVDVRQAEICGFLWKAEEWTVLDQVLRHGLDAHFAIAQKILGREPTKPERDDYKTTTFAMLFGELDRTTANRLHIPLAKVREARDFYFKMLPGVPDYRKRVLQDCQTRGFVESPAGIRRYIYLDRPTGRAANQACNHPIQNIPPMVIGEAMIILDRELPPPARMLMQVHDELVLTYPRQMRKAVVDCVWSVLRRPVRWLPAATLGMAGGLVFNLDFEAGSNWGALEKLEVS